MSWYIFALFPRMNLYLLLKLSYYCGSSINHRASAILTYLQCTWRSFCIWLHYNRIAPLSIILPTIRMGWNTRATFRLTKKCLLLRGNKEEAPQKWNLCSNSQILASVSSSFSLFQTQGLSVTRHARFWHDILSHWKLLYWITWICACKLHQNVRQRWFEARNLMILPPGKVPRLLGLVAKQHQT